MFHRVDDPLELPSSRFFRMARRLRLRDGAVAHALARDEAEREATLRPAAATSATPGIAQGTADDIAAMAAMSQHPGFPGIGYSGG